MASSWEDFVRGQDGKADQKDNVDAAGVVTLFLKDQKCEQGGWMEASNLLLNNEGLMVLFGSKD